MICQRIYVKDECPLTELQQEVLNACTKEGEVYIVPPGLCLYKKIGGQRSNVRNVINTLKKRGFKFKRGLTENQQKVLNGCIKKGEIYIIPKNLSKKVGKCSSNTRNTIKVLKKRGFKFEKGHKRSPKGEKTREALGMLGLSSIQELTKEHIPAINNLKRSDWKDRGKDILPYTLTGLRTNFRKKAIENTSRRNKEDDYRR